MTASPERAPHGMGIEAVAITKRFGEFIALDAVSLKIAPGTFHALLGENGAGKSTLVKCIMGYYRPDHGEVVVDNRERSIDNPRAAHALGLGMVYQHFTLVPAMTVMENLVLARDALPAVINWRKERQELETFLAGMPFGVPLHAKVSAISAGERRNARSSSSFICGAASLFSTSRPRCSRPMRPTRCSACCAAWLNAAT